MHKPLDSLENFQPTKTCSEYILQDCAEALPEFKKFAPTLVRECTLVATSILDVGLNRGLGPPSVFALVRCALPCCCACFCRLLCFELSWLVDFVQLIRPARAACEAPMCNGLCWSASAAAASAVSAAGGLHNGPRAVRRCGQGKLLLRTQQGAAAARPGNNAAAERVPRVSLAKLSFNCYQL